MHLLVLFFPFAQIHFRIFFSKIKNNSVKAIICPCCRSAWFDFDLLHRNETTQINKWIKPASTAPILKVTKRRTIIIKMKLDRDSMRKKAHTKTNKVGNIMRNAINVTYLYSHSIWCGISRNRIQLRTFNSSVWHSIHSNTRTRTVCTWFIR